MAAAPPVFETLTVSIEGSLGRLTLNQPDRLNPIGSTALVELAEASRWFDDEGAVVVIVSGAGRAFSSGFDLRELAVPSPRSESTPELGAAMTEAVSAMRALTVAQVQGPCVGGGFLLALCCDLRIAADDAWFSLPEAELGIPLAWSGVPRLVRELGPARSSELILTCRRAPADELYRWGVLNRVVPADALVDAVEELVTLLLERRREVVATTKAQVSAAASALVPTTGDWTGTDHLSAALRRLASGS